MTNPMPTLYATLSQDASHILRLAQPEGGTTTLLQAFSPAGCDTIELDPAALQAFLRALPCSVLLAALALQEEAPCMHDLAFFTDDEPLPFVLDTTTAQPPSPTPQPASQALPWWKRSGAGQLCACDRYADIHAAEATCAMLLTPWEFGRSGTSGAGLQVEGR